MIQNMIKNAGLSPVITVMVFTVLLSIFWLSATPAHAHAPEGAGEVPQVELEPIEIYNSEGNLQEITIDELAEIHGELCTCVAGSYRVTQTAIAVLYNDDELPVQGKLQVVYHHPGQGQKQVFEYVLTPDYAVYEKVGNPQQMTTDHWVYTFTRLDTGDIFETQVKEGVIHPDFFDLRYEVNGFKKGWHENEPTEEEKTLFATAYTETMNNFMTLPYWEIYSGVEEPEEPAPVGGIIFSSALILVIGVGFVYSSRFKRR